jgi:GH24 family phage-related lysozyme (muramidase)
MPARPPSEKQRANGQATAAGTVAASVQAAFPNFSATFEGRVPYMYLDILGLVTVGIGNLIDPVEEAQALPFQFKNAPETFATPDQIAAEWQTVKGDQSLKNNRFTVFDPMTQLQLSDDAINTLVLNRLTRNEAFLKRQQWFADFDTWPADAQMGLLSMAWAMGPAGPGQFPNFRGACQNHDFSTAAAQCKMNETGNAGLIPRNRANATLFSNAAIVLAGEAQGVFQRLNLYYPRALTAADFAPVAVTPSTTG